MRSESFVPASPLIEEEVLRTAQWRREEHLRVLQDANAAASAERSQRDRMHRDETSRRSATRLFRPHVVRDSEGGTEHE